jgi:hypothetical protein
MASKIASKSRTIFWSLIAVSLLYSRYSEKLPNLPDGATKDYSSIIYCTCWRPPKSWIFIVLSAFIRFLTCNSSKCSSVVPFSCLDKKLAFKNSFLHRALYVNLSLRVHKGHNRKCKTVISLIAVYSMRRDRKLSALPYLSKRCSLLRLMRKTWNAGLPEQMCSLPMTTRIGLPPWSP